MIIHCRMHIKGFVLCLFEDSHLLIDCDVSTRSSPGDGIDLLTVQLSMDAYDQTTQQLG